MINTKLHVLRYIMSANQPITTVA